MNAWIWDVIQPFDGGVFDSRYDDVLAPTIAAANLERIAWIEIRRYEFPSKILSAASKIP